MNSEIRSCEVCSCTRAERLAKFSVSAWPVVRCRDCGFVYLPSPPVYEALVETYAYEKTFAEETARRSKRTWSWLDNATRWRLSLGQRLDFRSRENSLGKCGNVLDIGCGSSCRLHQGVTPFGIEISAGLARQARPFFEARGGSVICAPATAGLDQFDGDFFESILMRSYLEHESRPREVLNKAFTKLKPGGVIYIRVPNFGCINRRVMGARWCGFRFPDHVNYFTGKSLRTLAQSIGYNYQLKNWASLFDDNLIVELRKPVLEFS